MTCLPTTGEVLSLMQKLSLSAAGCGHSSPSAGTFPSSCGKAGRELAPQGRLQGHLNPRILKKLELQAPPDRPFQALGRVWECVHTVTLFVKEAKVIYFKCNQLIPLSISTPTFLSLLCVRWRWGSPAFLR